MGAACQCRRTRRFPAALAAALIVVAGAGCGPVVQTPLERLVGTPAPGAVTPVCPTPDARITLTRDTALDPDCTYGGIDIRTSGVDLDCRGATIARPAAAGGTGILLEAPAGQPLTGVHVRNCLVTGFLNSARVSREGFKELPRGDEYAGGTDDIVIENSHFYASRGSGVFVNGYVSGVTLRGLEIKGAGSVGVYLEAGSKGTVLEDSTIAQNGTAEIEGGSFEIGGGTVRFQSTGREGIAVDGSRGNVIRRNRIWSNQAGGIFLYKNCGEYRDRAGHWVRPYGSDDNLIEDNEILLEPTGVWIGSRMAENQYFLECSDPPYRAAALTAIIRDVATDTTVRGNTFTEVRYGVRVEDDGARILDNAFASGSPLTEAVLLGTKERTEVLGEPVRDAVVTGNRAQVTGNPAPYKTIHPIVASTAQDNRADDVPVGLVDGVQPPIDPWLFVVRILPAG